MTYQIDADGSVRLGGAIVPVPRTVSAEAQQFLATPPWVQPPDPEAERLPMWALRDFVDEQMRLGGEAALQQYPVEVQEIEIAGVRCHMVKPHDMPEENKGLTLMNLHGGGFVMGSGSLVEAIPIAHQAKVAVIAVDYRLAPEHPYPAAVDDVVAVYRTMLDYHLSDQIGIYGTSAGGFLTGQTIMRLEREGLPLPACCGIFTAGGDLSDLGDTARIFTLMGFWGDLVLPSDHEISEIRAYLGGADPKSPEVSPIHGDLSRFPPTLLMSGTRDAVLSATANFHRALRRAGAQADLFVFEAMPHAHWYMLHLPEAREAISAMSEHFLRHLRPNG
ncbi:putative hydrolase [Sphingobium herbicidovorans NBRC 16415]|uniref:Hydrolase n=1 Tax=Sphingobium herbicidovorans (strain ATCC 700291 / DSM 11019 / CCUG 56400 / KCTC 2939 / LMG 18315 / NBRC 16415 / MH) TaxID=1219045 RepID=A0A086P4P5_SPHHM|nr:alpha/beta hydrolase fold domain-containing protein [Sphingobium herbicidovorans]KFG88363.1 putative hydrolase [Sphingobium herbicidovorans NBRC 16415]